MFCHLVARFDFSWGDADYHQETLDNLKVAVRSTKKLCAVCFLFSYFFNLMDLFFMCYMYLI